MCPRCSFNRKSGKYSLTGQGLFVTADSRSDATETLQLWERACNRVSPATASSRFFRIFRTGCQLLRDGCDLLDLVCLTDTLSTYPAFVSNWNIGFALTASPFLKDQKGTKKSSPHRTASREGWQIKNTAPRGGRPACSVLV